jgi:hypothetical protein
MSVLGVLAAAVPAVAGITKIGTDIANTVLGFNTASANERIAEGNLSLQERTLDYQKAMQREAWAREDMAVQRRVADLKAAGLSPTLAAGSAAQSSSPIAVTAPQRAFNQPKRIEDLSAGLQLMLGIAGQKADIARTNEETALLRMQQEKTSADTIGQSIDNAYRFGADPIRQEQLALDLEYAKLTNPHRIEQLILENKSKGLVNVEREVDIEIKKLGVTKEQIQIVRDRIAATNEHAKKGMADLEVISKQVAVEMQRVELEQTKRNEEYYKTLGLPSNAGMDAVTRGATIVGNATGNLGSRIKEGLRSFGNWAIGKGDNKKGHANTVRNRSKR